MRKLIKVVLAVGVLAALVGVIGWQVSKPSGPSGDEPVYQGRTLSDWLKVSNVNGRGLRQEGADEAVRKIGTNAIPTLLRMLRAKDSFLKVNLMFLAQRQHIFKVEYTPASIWNDEGRWGLFILGARANSAVPELIEIANSNISPYSQSSAIEALGGNGPAAKEAVPSLLRFATNANVRVSSSAILALRRIDPEAAAKVGITNSVTR